MSDNIQNTTTEQITPCLQPMIDKTRVFSTQSVEDRLKHVILHDLEHRRQGISRKSDEYVHDKQRQTPPIWIKNSALIWQRPAVPPWSPCTYWRLHRQSPDA